jgi:acetyl esterase/lipase
MLRSFVIAIVILALLTGAAAVFLWPLRVVSALTSRKGYSLRVDIAYGALPAQRLDVYMPDDAKTDSPVLLFIHGGGWAIGDKNEYRFVAQAFAPVGVIVVIPDYRLHPDVVFPEFVRDGAAAVAWTSRNLAGHPLFLTGHSAGAHIAALLNLDERYLDEAGVPRGAVAGIIGLSGPYDFLPLTEDRLKRIFPEASRDESQPIRFVDGTEAPMLLITGDADRTVRPGNTTRLAAAIEAKGGKAVVKIYPGVRHLGTMMALARILPYFKPPVRRDIRAFIAETLAR